MRLSTNPSPGVGIARPLVVALTLLLTLAMSASAVEVRVTIENVAPETGVFLTPMWVGFHDGSFDSYDAGVSADGFPGLENLAEDGDSSVLSADFAAQLPGGVQTTIAGPNGPIFPGESASWTTALDPAQHRYFSYVAMILPSNDAFVANGNPNAHRIFDTNGHLTPFSFYILGHQVNDAGTEVNDEVPANTAGLGQMAPNTGDTEGGVVTAHPGFMPGGDILAARPAGQFIAPGYRVAKVTVEPVLVHRVSFNGSGAQEEPPVATDATAACEAHLSSDSTKLVVHCVHDVEDVVAAHVHLGDAGENGPVAFAFTDPASPLEQTFDLSEGDVDPFFSAGYYVNIHSVANPGGEVRAQIDGCISGPTSNCLQGDRFQVTTLFQEDGDLTLAQAVPGSADTGFFTFFDPDNIEINIKVLDGCAINGHYWVFLAGLTDVGTVVVVDDTESTDPPKSYTSADGTAFELVRDIEAFSCN